MPRYIDVDKFAEKICDFQAIDENAANAMIWLLRTFPTENVAPIADTVREMLRRIKEDAVSVALLSNPPKFMLEIREYALDQIAKEMLEGKG